ncbi:hypothetical protein [Hymenobacter wooponensis]|uniref:Uncharacterized protein n=1 Tax=Hymenobacter wooponensis TaxID=1525360 RepID=A0A4Z0MBC6_9BACT|nr:hypothetical protein [Hymenobacter wooponensis]TGD76794.1 hypothetical protein EU557_25140 [Hymenobacter wooponensis]
MNALFDSNRKFLLFDALVSHGQLLLRAEKNEEHASNIDLLFFDTTYVQLPTQLLHGISIHQELSGKRFGYQRVDQGLDRQYQTLFELRTGPECYYIAAAFFRAYVNTLPFGETSLGVLTYQGREKEIASSL